MKYIFCMIVGLALTPIGRTHADILYDNGVGGLGGLNSGYASDYDNSAFGIQYFRADDFAIASNSILTGATWTGAYAFDNTPPAIDSFELAFFADAGGSPESLPFLSFNVDASRVDSGVDISGFDIYQYSADLAFPIIWNDSSTYWLSIRNRTFGEDDDWFWGSEDQLGIGNSHFMVDGGPWQFSITVNDFQLIGTTAIPEPSSAICLSILAMGAAVGTRRRRTASRHRKFSWFFTHAELI